MKEEIQTPVSAPAFFNKDVFIDAAIIIGLTFLGGAVIGFIRSAGGMSSSAHLMFIVVSNLGGVVLGSFIAGLRFTRGSLVRHLQAVGVLVWLFGLVNIALGITDVIQFVFSSFLIAILVALGGWLSTLISSRRA